MFPQNVPPVNQPGAQPASVPGQQPTQQMPQQTQQPVYNAPTQSTQYASGTPAPQAAQGLDLNAVVHAGPGVPAMFVGRRVGEILNIAQQALRRPVVQPQQQPPVTPAQQSLQAAGVQQPAQQQQQQFDPNTLQQIVREAIQQETLPDRVLRVYGDFQQRYQQYNAYEEDVLNIMRELPVEQQAIPQVWENALRIAIGNRALSGQQPAVQSANQQQGQYMFNQQQTNLPPNAWVPSGAQMFTEQPNSGTNGAAQSYQPQGRQMTPQEQFIARKLGLDPQKVSEFNAQNPWVRG